MCTDKRPWSIARKDSFIPNYNSYKIRDSWWKFTISSLYSTVAQNMLITFSRMSHLILYSCMQSLTMFIDIRIFSLLSTRLHKNKQKTICYSSSKQNTNFNYKSNSSVMYQKHKITSTPRDKDLFNERMSWNFSWRHTDNYYHYCSLHMIIVVHDWSITNNCAIIVYKKKYNFVH